MQKLLKSVEAITSIGLIHPNTSEGGAVDVIAFTKDNQIFHYARKENKNKKYKVRHVLGRRNGMINRISSEAVE